MIVPRFSNTRALSNPLLPPLLRVAMPPGARIVRAFPVMIPDVQSSRPLTVRLPPSKLPPFIAKTPFTPTVPGSVTVRF